ncbi:hypothetical protein PROFUN_00935 [Planoprotostelium fungivorum]|uniref:Uncharacterized protein n=1 Tax=Planoprotostelium fungivorum TaxID=1890364 RepID=A0A2P6N497_9EUKA|nr:hypothetical protein PROFUN_00935 [Planoprotostelium fungivorum]
MSQAVKCIHFCGLVYLTQETPFLETLCCFNDHEVYTVSAE